MNIRKIEREPVVSVGLMTGAAAATFELNGEFILSDGRRVRDGGFHVGIRDNVIELQAEDGRLTFAAPEIRLAPALPTASFVLFDVVIGIDFHWERKQDQRFRGALKVKLDGEGRLMIINEVPVESYLVSVISSEMSATSHTELLKAHAIISRSWLLAQLSPWKPRIPEIPAPPMEVRSTAGASPAAAAAQGLEKRLIRWYDRETHTDFDVCADDHCQRYQGVIKSAPPKVSDVIRATWGRVLAYGEELCDARFSKSCGGMTESFDAAWEDARFPYLAVSYDGETFPAGYQLPLTEEGNAEHWIRSAPPAFCNANDRKILGKILPDFDQETRDFYRWRVTLSQSELQELLRKKLGVNFGAVYRLEPVERGASGRLIQMRIVGSRETLVIGKELEIRRALSPSHLYSSAFVVEYGEMQGGAPSAFTLVGAGWGHGVGLCQIGAALMAERGYDYRRILEHYYRGARLYELYSSSV
jgi:SpoIID/LytB domain protein